MNMAILLPRDRYLLLTAKACDLIGRLLLVETKVRSPMHAWLERFTIVFA